MFAHKPPCCASPPPLPFPCSPPPALPLTACQTQTREAAARYAHNGRQNSRPGQAQQAPAQQHARARKPRLRAAHAQESTGAGGPCWPLTHPGAAQTASTATPFPSPPCPFQRGRVQGVSEACGRGMQAMRLRTRLLCAMHQASVARYRPRYTTHAPREQAARGRDAGGQRA